MFDPTVFDNIKVVLEGIVYELDLEEKVQITDRKDMVDLATMSRTYSIEFSEKHNTQIRAFCSLHTGVGDLSTEILEHDMYQVGCKLEVRFMIDFVGLSMDEVSNEALIIEKILQKIWENRPQITQKFSFEIKQDLSESIIQNEIKLDFKRKINENHLSDLEILVEQVLLSLSTLNNKFINRLF
ncbi:hypothetical protein [Chengkuizengella axinellae]|uniref:Group-specific protein n=1 Tax=Chengkuizengella axinellae TaxID=3064388 RepID=A0ABT9IXS1_9BACL|nr:hypothetical protein [Chengkuizengella sp. 2205SS18-9]MDP5274163.1 hypothetical protein [Chengkuizengella sp. 2205SS18-9]